MYEVLIMRIIGCLGEIFNSFARKDVIGIPHHMDLAKEMPPQSL